MGFSELLAQIRIHRLILRINRRDRVVLWAPNTYVPRSIRWAIPVYNAQLHAYIDAARIEVCPNPLRHRGEWYHAGQQRYVCAICERLAPFVSMSKKKSA